MAVSTRGRLLRRISAAQLGEVLPLPPPARELMRDGHDGCFVVEVGANRMRVNLAISSGGELVIPRWLKRAVDMLAPRNGEVRVYLSNRPLWLVPGEQDEAIRCAHAQHARAGGAATYTEPVALAPNLPNVDNVAEVIDLAEGEAAP